MFFKYLSFISHSFGIKSWKFTFFVITDRIVEYYIKKKKMSTISLQDRAASVSEIRIEENDEELKKLSKYFENSSKELQMVVTFFRLTNK